MASTTFHWIFTEFVDSIVAEKLCCCILKLQYDHCSVKMLDASNADVVWCISYSGMYSFVFNAIAFKTNPVELFAHIWSANALSQRSTCVLMHLIAMRLMSHWRFINKICGFITHIRTYNTVCATPSFEVDTWSNASVCYDPQIFYHSKLRVLNYRAAKHWNLVAIASIEVYHQHHHHFVCIIQSNATNQINASNGICCLIVRMRG